jgi:hypothetical protein
MRGSHTFVRLIGIWTLAAHRSLCPLSLRGNADLREEHRLLTQASAACDAVELWPAPAPGVALRFNKGV